MTANPTRELLTAFLRDSSARCPACGYALRGASSDRCPECGSSLSLSVVSAKPRASMWWLASTFGAALAVLISLCLLVAMLDTVTATLVNPWLAQNVRAGMASRLELPNWRAIILLLACALLSGLLLAWLIHSRRTFATWPMWTRVIVGVACWLSPALVLGVIAWWTQV